MSPKKNLLECYEDGNLDLSLSGIQDIPVRDIAAIPKAINLDLSSNIIVSVPKSFAMSLTRLVKLDLSQNQITSLPDNFGLLVNLKHLDLDNNKIESLPLSFGNLKNLRWLDLKRNPLMPKLAQIAGLCQDAQQCQAAARNVVAALRATQEQVNVEIARRKEEQIKTMEKLEESSKIQNKENQGSKKKKKKNANAAANGTDTLHVNGKTHLPSEGEDLQKGSGDSLPSVPTHKTAQNHGFFRKVFNALGTIIKLAVIVSMLVVFFGFVLSLLNEDLYMSLQKMVKTNIPRHYVKHWDNAMLVTRRAISNGSSQVIAISIYCFNKLQEYYITLSSSEKIQHYLEGFQNGWHILWIWLNETYTSLSVELPQAFSSVKKILFESPTTKS